jgi:centriolar protein POC1
VSDGAVRCLAVHPDPSQKILAAGSKEGSILIYNYQSNQLIQDIQAHDHLLTALTFDPSGVFLLSAARDSKLKMFDCRAAVLRQEWVPHLFAVYKIAFHPTKPYFATASRDKDIKIWSFPDGKLKKSISVQKGMPAHRLSVNSIAWSASGDQLISVGDDKMVLVWNMDFEEETNG